MKIKIKKYYVAAVTGLIFGVSAYYLFGIFSKALSEDGWFGIINFLLFITTLVWQIVFWWGYKVKSKIVEDVAKEMVSKMLKTDLSLFDHTSQDSQRSQIIDNLQKVIDDDSYIINLWPKRK